MEVLIVSKTRMSSAACVGALVLSNNRYARLLNPGDYNQLKASSLERLNLSLTFYYHPKFFEDLGFFVQYYRGSDYYNMYFDDRLDVLRFGIMTEKLRF